jgi:hypothetical protein
VSFNAKCSFIVWPFGLSGHLVYFMAILFILWPFGIYFPVLVCCTKKNIATLAKPTKRSCLQKSNPEFQMLTETVNVAIVGLHTYVHKSGLIKGLIKANKTGYMYIDT